MRSRWRGAADDPVTIAWPWESGSRDAYQSPVLSVISLTQSHTVTTQCNTLFASFSFLGVRRFKCTSVSTCCLCLGVCVWGGRGALVASKIICSDVENKTGLVKDVKKLRCCLANQFSQLSKKCKHKPIKTLIWHFATTLYAWLVVLQEFGVLKMVISSIKYVD